MSTAKAEREEGQLVPLIRNAALDHDVRNLTVVIDELVNEQLKVFCNLLILILYNPNQSPKTITEISTLRAYRHHVNDGRSKDLLVARDQQ